MAEAVRNAVAAAAIPLADALRMATATPAAVGRLHDRGRIAPGLRADLVALDSELCVSRRVAGRQADHTAVGLTDAGRAIAMIARPAPC